MKFLLIAIYILITTSCNLNAQSNYITSTLEFGKIIPHHNNVKRIVKKGTKAISLGWEKHTYGNKIWEIEYNKPIYGINLKYADLGNKDELGETFSISPYFGFHTISKNNFHWYNSIGIGLLYANNTFDIDENPFNKVISSKINCTVILKSEIQINLNKFNITSGLGINHISNGNSNVPNLGLNDVFFMVGLQYKVSEKENAIIDENYTENITIDKKLHPKMFISFGASSLKPAGVYPRYLTTTFNFGLEKRLSYKSIIESGFDILYNSSHIESIKRSDKINEIPTNFDVIRFGWYLGYNVKIADLRIIINAGYYLKNKYDLDGSLYQRIGVRYYITKHIVSSFAIRAHGFSVADHFELGLGYKF